MKSLVNPDDDRTSYSYDAAGRRTVKELANDTRASYTYDDANRVTLLGNLKSDSSVISSFDYEYDAVGNRTRVVEADGDRVTWTYDPTYQLLAEHRDGVDAYAHTFSYDPVGNRLTEDNDTTVTTSVCDVANRLTYSETPSGRTTYTFDADGNQRSIEIPAGDITTQTWSYENKLVQIEEPLGEVATYAYALVKRDATEQRVGKDDGADVVRFVWDEDRIITQLDDLGTVEVEYTLEPAAFGNLLSQKRAAESSYYHYDALGSTESLTDSAEVVDNTYTYQAFGEIKSSGGTVENPFTWVGEVGYYRDEESSLYSLRARPYDPANWGASGFVDSATS